jgi:mono/diheme cytochrome c family protein
VIPLLALVAAALAAEAEAPADPLPEDPLYVEHCAGCHGKHGRATFPGVMMGAGSFASASFWEDRPPERLRDTIVRGGAAVGIGRAMPAFADRLTDAEIDRLLAVALAFRPPAP